MKPATRNTSAIAKLLPALSLVGIIALFASINGATAGQHYVEPGTQSVAGCIDGACGTPAGPYGHYQGSWRRWPYSKDSQLPANRQGTIAREPFVPDVLDEGRTRPRTRSDRPLDPKDMGSSAGVGTLPLVPAPGDEANPFNNTVDDSDMQAGGNPSEGVGEGNPFPPAGGNATDPLFDSPPAFDEPAPGGDADFGVPGDDANSDEIPDLFGHSELIPPPTKKVRRQEAIRSIKSRGVTLLKDSQSIKIGSSKQITRGLENPSPDQGNIDLVSFEDFETKSRSAQMPQRIAKLSESQVVETSTLPPKQPGDANQSLAVDESHAANEDAAESELEHDSVAQDELPSQNPLRKGKSTPRKPVKSTTPKAAQAKATPIVELPKKAEFEMHANSESRTLSQAVASRSLRDTLRKNPLRR